MGRNVGPPDEGARSTILFFIFILVREMSMLMSKTFIGGAVCREFESEAPEA